MSANVETMFYTDADGRNAPWHGLGVRVYEAPTSDDALVAAGLDWEVKQVPAYIEINGEKVPTGEMVNYRDIDNKVLGTVSERYSIVQNKDAFAFTDALIGTQNVRYETAGSLNGGRTVWLLAKLPEMSVLGDAMDSYLLFSTSHDGSSCVRCNVTNVRVVCQNTLNFALRTALRSWSFCHKGDIDSKIDEARRTLIRAKQYNEEFAKEADALACKKISPMKAKEIIDAMFPVEEEGIGKIRLGNLIKLRDNFRQCYNADDIADYKGTAWGMLNAFSDMIYHGGATLRRSENYDERRLISVINGNQLFDKAYAILQAA